MRKIILETLNASSEMFEDIQGLKYLPYRLIWAGSLQGYRRNSVDVSLHRAIKQGLINKSIKKDQVYLALTDLGKSVLEQEGSRSGLGLSLDKTEGKWDGLYRFIFFDIPETDRVIRDLLRNQLKRVGAVNFQKSVWVTKENITRELNRFIQENDLADYISLVEVKEIYNPKLIRLLEDN